MDKRDVDIRCEICNSTQTYYRIKTNERVCKICGHIQNEEIKEEENGNTRT